MALIVSGQGKRAEAGAVVGQTASGMKLAHPMALQPTPLHEEWVYRRFQFGFPLRKRGGLWVWPRLR